MSAERLHPAADSDRCRHPQPNRGWSLGTLMEELRVLEGIGTPQKDKQNQLTWTLTALRDKTTKQSIHRLYLAPPPCTYVPDVQLGLYMGPEQLEWGYPKSCCLSVEFIPQQRCLVWPQWERMCLDLQRMCQGGQIPKVGELHSLKEGTGGGGKNCVRGIGGTQ